MNFSDFCNATPTHYESLYQKVNFCASQGHSYEYPHCSLPNNCLPSEVTLGLCRQENGYLLYWRPTVCYHGENRVLKILFMRNQWHFDSFEALTRWLHSLAPAISFSKNADIWPPLYLQLRKNLESVVFGQPEATSAVAFRLYSHLGKRAPSRPLSLIFYGPTGVGKSELGKALPSILEKCTGKPWQLVWTELNTFTQAHSVHRLIGAPPGYVGYEDSPIFEAVQQNCRSVFMFDELEKAHPEILKVFMSILDEGRCTAHRTTPQGNRELDFRQCILIFTTNADLTAKGSRPLGFYDLPIPAADEKKTSGPEELAQRLFSENEIARQAMVHQGILPEIAGRFSGLIGFHQLDNHARLSITIKQIKSLGREYGLEIASVEPALAQELTPQTDLLSTRSAVCILESLLSPLFSQANHEGPLTLSGTRQSLRLTPLYVALPRSVTVPSAFSL